MDEAGAVFINRLPQLNGVMPGCECLDLCVYFYLPPTSCCLCIWLSRNVYLPFSEVMMSRRRNTSNNRGGKSNNNHNNSDNDNDENSLNNAW